MLALLSTLGEHSSTAESLPPTKKGKNEEGTEAILMNWSGFVLLSITGSDEI